MNDKVKALASKAEDAVGPAAALITFIKTPLGYYQAGGFRGLVEGYKQNFLTWHPPTLETIASVIDKGGGEVVISGAAATIGLFFTDFIPDADGVSAGKSAIKMLLRTVLKGSIGTGTGLIADAFIHPTKYNPTQESRGGSASAGRQLGVVATEWNVDVAKPKQTGGRPR